MGKGMLLLWSWGGDRAEPYVVEKGPVRVRHDDAVASVFACGNTKGYSSTNLAMGFANVRAVTWYSSTYLAMGFANVRAGTWYPPEH